MMHAVLLAHPAGHSLSPVMHDAGFAAVGLDARYAAWDVRPDDLPAAVERLRGDGMLGANVTVPHKVNVLPLLDEVRPTAASIGAVNVIVRNGERLIGDSSDGAGFLRSLSEAEVDVRGRSVALLGAGGAARAVAWALVGKGVGRLTIVNRTASRADQLAAAIGQRDGRATVDVAATVDELTSIDLWVNATSLGMRREGHEPDVTPVEAPDLAERSSRADPVAVDLVYRPRRTPFLREAERAGLRTVDGVGMLLHQGTVAFEAWTGLDAPIDAMRTALERALADETPA